MGTDVRVALVTGYVRLPCTHRSHEAYLELGGRLLGLGLPTLAFLDGSAAHVAAPAATRKLPASFETCWLYRDAAEAGHAVVPGGKDTPAYHCAIHEKTAWLAQALDHTDADIVAWVDFGIFHNPRIMPEHVFGYYTRLASAALDRIMAASIWPLEPTSPISHDFACWYLAGGVIATPRRMARWLDAAVKEEARRRLLDGGGVTWEVNTLAAVAKRNLPRFHLYRSDHDATLFTGFGSQEDDRPSA